MSHHRRAQHYALCKIMLKNAPVLMDLDVQFAYTSEKSFFRKATRTHLIYLSKLSDTPCVVEIIKEQITDRSSKRQKEQSYE